MKNGKWIQWAIKLNAIAQAGLTYTTNEFDKERYNQIKEIAFEIIATHTDLTIEKIYNLFEEEKGYQTPKIDVRAVIIDAENKILLVKEKLTGKWCMPGGWADCGLTLKENVIKETKEETGFNVEPVRILAIMDRNIHNFPRIPMSIYKIFVEANLIDGSFKENIETETAAFFPLNDLPILDEKKTTQKQVELCFKLRNNFNTAPYFD